jgi:hypothetical protein
VIGVALLTVRLNSIGDPGWNPLAPLSTAPALADPAPIFTDRPAWSHLVWLVGLTTAVGVAAIARHRRDRVVAGIGVAALVVALVAAVSATRPLPAATADRIADRIAHPAEHQECVTAGPAVQVCAYRAYGEQLERVVSRIGPVAEALPAGQPAITLRQKFDSDAQSDFGDLPPEVRRRLLGGLPPRADGEVPLGFTASVTALDRAAFDVAFTAVRLPLRPGSGRVPAVIVGQARGVVALWLVTRGLDADRARALATSAAPNSSDPFERGSLDLDPCAEPSVVWSGQDLAAAREVLALPEADVARLLGGQWARWSNPATGTDELLRALGLAGVGPFDHVEPRSGQGC